MPSRRHILRAALALPGLCLARPPAAAQPRTHEVGMVLFSYQPARIEIAAGDSVRWTNSDAIPHSATAAQSDPAGAPLFDTGLFGKGESREVTFPAPGRFAYACRRHPAMTGEVIVR